MLPILHKERLYVRSRSSLFNNKPTPSDSFASRASRRSEDIDLERLTSKAWILNKNKEEDLKEQLRNFREFRNRKAHYKPPRQKLPPLESYQKDLEFVITEAPGRVLNRLERLMGTDKVKITDNKYMGKLYNKLEKEEADTFEERALQRRKKERERYRKQAMEEGNMTGDGEDVPIVHKVNQMLDKHIAKLQKTQFPMNSLVYEKPPPVKPVDPFAEGAMRRLFYENVKRNQLNILPSLKKELEEKERAEEEQRWMNANEVREILSSRSQKSRHSGSHQLKRSLSKDKSTQISESPSEFDDGFSHGTRAGEPYGGNQEEEEDEDPFICSYKKVEEQRFSPTAAEEAAERRKSQAASVKKAKSRVRWQKALDETTTKSKGKTKPKRKLTGPIPTGLDAAASGFASRSRTSRPSSSKAMEIAVEAVQYFTDISAEKNPKGILDSDMDVQKEEETEVDASGHPHVHFSQAEKAKEDGEKSQIPK